MAKGEMPIVLLPAAAKSPRSSDASAITKCAPADVAMIERRLGCGRDRAFHERRRLQVYRSLGRYDDACAAGRSAVGSRRVTCLRSGLA